MGVLDSLSQLLPKIKTRLNPVVSNVERILSPVTEFTRANPLVSSIALGTTSGIVAGSITRAKKRKSTKRKKKKSTKTKSRRKNRKYKKSKCSYRKRKCSNSRKRIRHTKNGQPYIILASGKARFIKKKSCRTMKKRKGGYR